MLQHPSLDGVKHVNIYSGGKTQLGKALSNFAALGCGHNGLWFASMEALWFYLQVRSRASKVELLNLTMLSGSAAKRTGLELCLKYGRHPNESFHRDIFFGMISKLYNNQHLVSWITSGSCSKLPFCHYYWKGKESAPEITPVPQHNWQVQCWEQIRYFLQKGDGISTIMQNKEQIWEDLQPSLIFTKK